jgi:hypothetical protein
MKRKPEPARPLLTTGDRLPLSKGLELCGKRTKI